MKLRTAMLLVLTGSILAIAVVALQRTREPELLVLNWAKKANTPAAPVAVLIEMGRKDVQATKWNGIAVVNGAAVVHREGYHFHDKDELVAPDGWSAASSRPAGQKQKKVNPAIAAMGGMSVVGVVLHLADVKPGATLTVSGVEKREAATIPLGDVLAGKTASLWDGAAVVRLVSTATPVSKSKTEDDFPAAAYGPDGALWVAYISYTLKEESRRIDAKPIKQQPADFKAYDTPEYGDQLFVKSLKDGKWSAPIAVTEPKQDLVGCAIAVEGNGTVWPVYSAFRDGKHELLARPITEGAKLGAEEKLASDENRHIFPGACTANDGKLYAACQVRKPDGASSVSTFVRENGKWRQDQATETPGRSWFPAICEGPGGQVFTTYDQYHQGDYDVFLLTSGGTKPVMNQPLVTSSKYEGRPAVAYDPQGRVWVAYEEGPEQWGKDFGALDDDEGNPLYFARTVKVVCIADGKLMKPAAELPPMAPREKSPTTGASVEKMPRISHPQIGIDGKGRVWLTYIQKFGTRNTSPLGSHWLTFARRLDGDTWSEPIEVHHSDGMMDPHRILLPHPAGGLRIVCSSDGRWTQPDDIGSQIYLSEINLPGDPVEPKLVPFENPAKDEKLLAKAKAEQDAIARMRGYRIDAGGKSYRPIRGEYHRHTEISWDGGPDGSINDMFRYGIDAADMDWIGCADHDNGGGREYTWWITQKLTDAYRAEKQFIPMFCYERSVSYPHGHRNCLFARRGIRTLPRLAAPDPKEAVAGIHADDAKMFYRYLHELDGVCASHTCATTMGTDWRDNDPVVEPLVEIYQGDRNSYEHQGAPRAGYEASSGKLPVQIGGWFPDGFIDLALGKKGYKLGFQASSDHFSTHISYAIVLTERFDRDAIIDAMKKRHAYGATDNILMDIRCGENIMGDEFKVAGAPKLDIHVVGTGKIKAVEVMKDSKPVASFAPAGSEHRGTWTDPNPSPGSHYYYVRVLQEDNEIAWSSPMWITSMK